ncbi:MAG: XopAH/AvrB family type III secretion system effector [Reinekea sp.]|jgi:avirulence protein
MGCINSKQSFPIQETYTASPNYQYRSASDSHISSGPNARLPGLVESRLPDTQIRLIGVARWPDSNFNQDDFPHQWDYGRAFWEGTRETGASLASGEIQSFSEIWQAARDWRCERPNCNPRLFGTTRLIPEDRNRVYATPLTNSYRYVRDKFEGRNDGILDRVNDDVTEIHFPLCEKLHGNIIRLTTTVLNTNPSAHRNDEAHRYLNNEAINPFRLSHTDISTVEEILMPHIDNLFENLKNSHETVPRTMKRLGDLHWWLANAMPDRRGSAAKSEFVIRSIAQAKGIDLPPMKYGLVADIEAMTTSRSTFIKNYSNMFEAPDL